MNPFQAQTISFVKGKIEKVSTSWYHSIKEWITIILKRDLCGPLKAIEMCLILVVVIFKGLKVLQFNKFIRSQCPLFYMWHYYINMGKVIHDDILLIHHFHERLDGSTLSCYMSFNKTIIKKKKMIWKRLI
jgi:hypothetical protein